MKASASGAVAATPNLATLHPAQDIVGKPVEIRLTEAGPVLGCKALACLEFVVDGSRLNRRKPRVEPVSDSKFHASFGCFTTAAAAALSLLLVRRAPIMASLCWVCSYSWPFAVLELEFAVLGLRFAI